MSDRETILQLRKAVKDAEFIIKRQNEEIEELTKKCDSLKSVIDGKRYEIKRLKYKVKKLQERLGVNNG